MATRAIMAAALLGIAAAASWLTTEGIERVAYLASGTVGAELLAAHAAAGAEIDQLILISGDLTDAALASLGAPPNLFVTAEGDAAGAAAANRMAADDAGAWNALLVVPGEDYGVAILGGEGASDLIDGVVARLEERR